MPDSLYRYETRKTGSILKYRCRCLVGTCNHRTPWTHLRDDASAAVYGHSILAHKTEAELATEDATEA